MTVDDLLREAYAALKAYELLDDKVANCEEHAPEDAPEVCEYCFPFADNARCKMRAAIANIEGHAESRNPQDVGHTEPTDLHAAICRDSDPCPACGPKLASGQSLEEFCDLYGKFS